MTPRVKGRKKLSATDARNLRTLLLLNVFAPEQIGARIAQARLEAGLTQEELAALVGVSTRSLQGYEAGDVKPYRHIEKIAEVTGADWSWILHGEKAQAPPVLSRVEELLQRVEQRLGETPSAGTFGIVANIVRQIVELERPLTDDECLLARLHADELRRTADAAGVLADAIEARLAQEGHS